MTNEIVVTDRDKAKELNESIRICWSVIKENYVLLACNLRDMLDGEYWKVLGHNTIESYALSISMSVTTIEYFARIARRFGELGIDFSELEWTKAREILPVLTESNKDEWIEKAKTMSVRDLIADVRAHKKERGIKEVKPIGNVVIPFFNEDDGKTMAEGLELAAKVTGSDRRDIQFLAMCQEFMGTYSNIAEGMISDKVKEEILKRDGYKCRVPWCRRRTNLTVHEIIFRSHGGKVEKGNSITLCQRCHGLVTDGRMKIEKTEIEGRIKFIGRKINFVNDKKEKHDKKV